MRRLEFCVGRLYTLRGGVRSVTVRFVGGRVGVVPDFAAGASGPGILPEIGSLLCSVEVRTIFLAGTLRIGGLGFGRAGCAKVATGVTAVGIFVSTISASRMC